MDASTGWDAEELIVVDGRDTTTESKVQPNTAISDCYQHFMLHAPTGLLTVVHTIRSHMRVPNKPTEDLGVVVH